MPTTSVLLKPGRSRRFSSVESPVYNRSSHRPAQIARKQRSRLDSPNWRPYRNNEDLAQQVYELTHPDELTYAELAREAALALALEPYQAAVIRLSELLR